MYERAQKYGMDNVQFGYIEGLLDEELSDEEQ